MQGTFAKNQRQSLPFIVGNCWQHSGERATGRNDHGTVRVRQLYRPSGFEAKTASYRMGEHAQHPYR